MTSQNTIIANIVADYERLQSENELLKQVEANVTELHNIALEEIESLRQDAERYRTIRQIMQSAKGGAFLECNRELGYYEKPEEGKEVRLQWYPDTPVGFYLVEASTIDAVVDKTKE